MKRIVFIILFLLFFIPPSVKGQEIFGNQFHQAFGFSTFIDYLRSPPTIYEDPSGVVQYAQVEGYSFLTVAYRGRMNLVEPTDQIALSSSVNPALGVSFFQQGMLHFNLPVMLQGEFGAASTAFSMDGKFGVVAGIGYEFTAAPLVIENKSPVPPGVPLNSTWLQQAYTLGVRYKRGGSLMELNVKLGIGQGKFVSSRFGQVHSRSIRLMALYFI